MIFFHVNNLISSVLDFAILHSSCIKFELGFVYDYYMRSGLLNVTVFSRLMLVAENDWSYFFKEGNDNNVQTSTCNQADFIETGAFMCYVYLILHLIWILIHLDLLTGLLFIKGSIYIYSRLSLTSLQLVKFQMNYNKCIA